MSVLCAAVAHPWQLPIQKLESTLQGVASDVTETLGH